MESLDLRIGNKYEMVGGIFFVLIIDEITYMWEDMYELNKWVKWPEEWHPLMRNVPCSVKHFEDITGCNFQETLDELAI